MTNTMQEIAQTDTAAETPREEIIAAFKDGVLEVLDSGTQAIFIDPASLQGLNDQELTEQFEQQMEQQAPGSAAIFRETFESNESYLRNLQSLYAFNPSAAATAEIEIDGTKYGVVKMPSEAMDTKAEVINIYLGVSFSQEERDQIIENTTGTASQWARMIGNHEGEHTNRESSKVINEQNNAVEETFADRRMIEEASKRGEREIVQGFIDVRALGLFDGTGQHKTIPFLEQQNGQYSTEPPMNGSSFVTSARTSLINALSQEFDINVSQNTQLIVELRNNNPSRFMETLDTLITEKQSTEHTTQSELELLEAYRNALIRRVLNGSTPNTTLEIESDTRSANNHYTQGIEGTAYTANVSGIITGTPVVDTETGVTVGDITIETVFSQIANPEPENISLINAKIEPTEQSLQAQESQSSFSNNATGQI